MKRITTDLSKNNLAIVQKPATSTQLNELIDEWLDYLRIDGARPKTLIDYQGKISKFRWFWEKYHPGPDGLSYSQKLGNHPENVTSKEARAFASYLRTPTIQRWGIKSHSNPSKDVLSPESVKSYGRAIKSFFSWLASDSQRYIDRNPFDRYVKFSSKHDHDKTIKVISPEGQEKIWAVLTDPLRLETFTGKRNLALIALLADSGIRRGELATLRVQDVDLAKRRCTVNGKTGQRIAFFGLKCANALINYMSASELLGRKPADPLWLTVDGIPLAYSGIQNIINDLKRQTGVNFSAHKFRHTFATQMAHSGINGFDLMSLLGHENIATTRRYLHDNPDHNQEIYNRRSPLDKQDVQIKRRGRPPKER